MSAARRRFLLGGGALLATAILTVVGVSVSGAKHAPPPPVSPDLELFADKEKLRDHDWPPMNEAARLLEARIPSREGDADRMLILERIAARNGVRVVSASFMPPALLEGGPYRVVTGRATVTGEPPKVAAWIEAVERFQRLISVEAMSLSRLPEGVAIRADAQLQFPLRSDALDLKPYQAPLREE